MQRSKIILIQFLIAVSLLFGCETLSKKESTAHRLNSVNEKTNKVETLFSYDKHFAAFQTKKPVLLHINLNPGLSDGAYVDQNTFLGTMQPIPAQLSQHNEQVLRQAETLYNRKLYLDAVNLLLTVDDEETDNVFYLYLLGRATYWITEDYYRRVSYGVYEKLIRLIDAQSSLMPKENSIIVDLWFVDAYLKYGTLHLDNHNYPQAIFELSKVLYANLPDATAKDMACSYITEAYYFLNNKELNNYFYLITKANNGNNRYVEKFHL